VTGHVRTAQIQASQNLHGLVRENLRPSTQYPNYTAVRALALRTAAPQHHRERNEMPRSASQA
jgi:hypothetical protein